MRRFGLRCLCLVALLFRDLVYCTIIDDEELKRTFPARRAIDGTRGRKYYEPEEDNPYESYGSSNGRYDPYEEETDLADIRNNVPGEPGVDYPAYTRLPQTEFVCEAEFRGYYADEGAGCQVFHVCDGSFIVSSFLCPIGSIFSQKLLTCDWWTKVDCSLTRNYHAVNIKSHVSEVDDDEILRKAFEMARVQSAGERIPVETMSQQKEQDQQERHHDRRPHQRIFNYGGSVNERVNDLSTGREGYSDYSDYPTRLSSRYKSRGNEERRRQDDYYGDDVTRDDDENPPITVHSRGENRQNDHHHHRGSFRNEFQPSYAPTVPTVATTARRYYSPTVPTTYKPPTTPTSSIEPFPRYDLQFEGSDHLYTAHGRSDDSTVTSPSSTTKDFRSPDQEDSPIETTFEETYDGIQESASSINFDSLVEAAVRNLTELESTNETVASLHHKEKAIQEDLDRLTQKITETLSILTIDEANRDPAVFSYSHNDNRKSPDESNVAELPVSTNLTEPSVNEDTAPPSMLEPPSQHPSPFRIMILEGNSTPGKENSSDARSSSRRNLTGEDAPAPINATVLSFSSDRKEQRDSRVFRIVVDKNATTVDSPNDFAAPKLLIENVKSIDASPRTFTDSTNFTRSIGGSKIAQDGDSNRQFMNVSSSSQTPFDRSPVFTTSRPNNATRKETTFESANRTVVTREAATADFSTSATRPIPEATTDRPGENIPHIFPLRITDAIELATSPVQFTLTVNKTDNIDPSGDEIRKLIAQRAIADSIGAADYKSFEIVRSEEPQSSAQPDTQNPRFNHNVAEDFRTSGRINHESRIADDTSEISSLMGLRSADDLRSIVRLVNGPNSPRPFAQNVEFQTKNLVAAESTQAPVQRSTETIISTSEKFNAEFKSLESLKAFPSGLPKNLKIHRANIAQSSNTPDDSARNKNREKLIFELPDARRLTNFQTGPPLDISDRLNSRHFEKAHDDSGRNVTGGKTSEVRVETVVQTEFVPSLGFSLNTDEERETYMDAVVKGLLHDFRATDTTMDANKTTIAES